MKETREKKQKKKPKALFMEFLVRHVLPVLEILYISIIVAVNYA